MSKFLGPIHYIMYEKIKFQDELTAKLLSEGELEKLNEKMPPVSKDNLENIIDQDNIHGFLSSRIDIVESRLSYAIKKGSDVYNKAYEFGKSIAPKSLNGFEEIFDAINNIILDGMPCDRALEVGVDNDKLYLKTVVDTHEKYEDSPLLINPDLSRDNTCDGNHDHDDHESFHVKDNIKTDTMNEEGDASDYYRLREALLKGFLEPSGHSVTRINKNFIVE